MVVVERVHVLRVHADVDGGRRHLVCACGRRWGTWTPCVRADGLLVDADEYKQKTKNYLPCNGYRAMSIRLRCVQTRWRADTDDCEEKKKNGNPTKYKSWMWMVNADG